MAADDAPEDLDPGRHLDRGGLKISRRRGEAIVVGDARITVAEIGEREVRLYVEAPRDVTISRDPR